MPLQAVEEVAQHVGGVGAQAAEDVAQDGALVLEAGVGRGLVLREEEGGAGVVGADGLLREQGGGWGKGMREAWGGERWARGVGGAGGPPRSSQRPSAWLPPRPRHHSRLVAHPRHHPPPHYYASFLPHPPLPPTHHFDPGRQVYHVRDAVQELGGAAGLEDHAVCGREEGGEGRRTVLQSLWKIG